MLIINTIILVIIFTYLFFPYKKKESRMNLDIMKNFENYIVILEYHCKKAYDIIFKDQIMIYSIEAMKLDDKQYKEASKKFAKLVLKLIGPTLQKEFEYIYGNQETLLFNITEYFNTKFENDEVFRYAQNKIMNGEENNSDMTNIFSSNEFEKINNVKM